jgi:hypothetical protein
MGWTCDGGCWWEDKEKTKGQHGSGHISTAQHSRVQQAHFYISLARSRGKRGRERQRESKESESKETQKRERRQGERGESVAASSNRAKA